MIDNKDYEITLDVVDVASQFRSAFTEAADRWAEVITGDLPEVEVSEVIKGNSTCTRLPDVIDDLFICSRVGTIDGPGRVLG